MFCIWLECYCKAALGVVVQCLVLLEETLVKRQLFAEMLSPFLPLVKLVQVRAIKRGAAEDFSMNKLNCLIH